MDTRIGHADRESAAAVLATALRDGQLDLAEYERRLVVVQAARVRADLVPVLADLRISTAEREHALARLTEALTDGRIGAAEYEGAEELLHRAVMYADVDEVLGALDKRANAAEREQAIERIDPAGYQVPLSVRLASSGTATVVLGAVVLMVAGLSVVAAVLCAVWSIWLAAGVTKVRPRVAVTGPRDEEPRAEPEPEPEPEPPVEQPRLLQGPDGYILSLTCLVLPDGTPVSISGSNDNTAIVWDLANATRRHTLSGHTHDVSAVAAMVLPDGSPVAVTLSEDGTAKVWDLRDGSLRGTLTDLARDTRSLACLTLPDGTPVAIVHADRVIQLWDLRDNRLLRRFDNDANYSRNAVVPLVLDDEPVAVVCGNLTELDEHHTFHNEHALEIVSLVDWTPKTRLSGHTHHIRAIDVAVLPDGTAVAVSASDDKTIRVWDLRKGTLLHTFTGMIEPYEAVSCVSRPDGTPIVVACASHRAKARVWDLLDGSELGTFEQQGDMLAAAALPDQTLVVCRTYEGLAVRSLFQAGGSTVL